MNFNKKNIIDLTIVIPTKNEEKNLPSCLEPIYNWASEIVIVDSNSSDNTKQISEDFGVEFLNFNYKGGWPKKRQFVLESYKFKTNWVLLLDSDEILTDESKREIEKAIIDINFNGYFLLYRMEFLGKMITKADPGMRKLSLFRVGFGNFEIRLADQDTSMGDMEVHEHVIVNGNVGVLENPILHRNVNSLSRFIIKHDEYSNYESKLFIEGGKGDLKENFFGSKEERRRFLKKRFIRNPISPIGYFIYLFIIKRGFLDGKSGFYYILYQCIYLYFISSKIYEHKVISLKTINSTK
jgi:glycosyltransferase involved in cell wall biosynthesis